MFLTALLALHMAATQESHAKPGHPDSVSAQASASALRMSAGTAHNGTASSDTTQILLAEGDLTQLKKFLRSVVDTLGKAKFEQLEKTYARIAGGAAYTLILGAGVQAPYSQLNGMQLPGPNMVVMADSVPAIARALTRNRLTARRYLQLYQALNCASMTIMYSPSDWTDATTTLGKNVAFLRLHTADFHQLNALGFGGMEAGASSHSDLDP